MGGDGVCQSDSVERGVSFKACSEFISFQNMILAFGHGDFANAIS